MLCDNDAFEYLNWLAWVQSPRKRESEFWLIGVGSHCLWSFWRESARWNEQSWGWSPEAAVPGRKICIEVLHLAVTTNSYCTKAIGLYCVCWVSHQKDCLHFKMKKSSNRMRYALSKPVEKEHSITFVFLHVYKWLVWSVQSSSQSRERIFRSSGIPCSLLSESEA